MQKYTDTVIKDGKPIAGLTVSATNYPAGTAATIYSTTGSAVSSVLTDANGRFEFYAPNGHYSITVSGTGINPYTLNDIVLFDPVDNGAAAVSATGGQNVQTALNSKAPIASPNFTGGASVIGNFTVIDASHVLSSTSSNTLSRNFAVGQLAQFGRLDFNVSNARLGDPIAAGTMLMSLDSSGNLTVGSTTGSSHRINKNAVAGQIAFEFTQDNGVSSLVRVFGSDNLTAANASTANACLKVGAPGTGRSISTAGTINASGADYAEYMSKADACGVIAAGQIAGVNAAGLLTDKWADAVSFLVKSTNPSYVGGDTWGAEESLGMARPAEPVFVPPEYTGSAYPGGAPNEDADDDERAAYAVALASYKSDLADYTVAVQAARQQFDTITVPEYREQLAVFEAALEVARQKVDRMAFCGQVPVNVQGATPGQYVVPVQNGDGIAGQLVDAAAITFDQYRRAVGIVQNLLPDGRANVRVKPV